MTRLEIIQQINPRFSFDAYTKACVDNGFEPRQMSEWAQLMGILSAAEYLYPGLPIDESYFKYVALSKERSVQPRYIAEVPTQSSSGCGGCGGGKIL